MDIQLRAKKRSRPAKKKRIERILAVAALLILLIAWVSGKARSEKDVYPYIQQLYPNAAEIEKLSSGNYVAWEDEAQQAALGYISINEANGYGGPLKLAVSTDGAGNVTGTVIISQKETPSYLLRVSGNGYFESLIGKEYSDRFVIGEDVDGVSGATYTTQAIAEAARLGSTSITANELNLTVPPTPAPKISFGLLELTLIVLFAVGYFGHQKKFPYKKQARWVSMIVGLVVLGFIYNNLLTLTSINRLLLGFWPDWHSNLHWYILIFGIFFVFTVDNKNPYCEWFCPFGAAQECMGVVGGAKARSAGKYRDLITWSTRILVWGVIVLALFFRNPSFISYEIFGALFNLTGTTAQFILLGLILVAAIFMRRPWCNTLCPVSPIVDLIRLVRGWIKELWQRKILVRIRQ